MKIIVDRITKRIKKDADALNSVEHFQKNEKVSRCFSAVRSKIDSFYYDY